MNEGRERARRSGISTWMDTVPQEVLVELSSRKRNDDKVEEDAGGKACSSTRSISNER